MPCSSSRTALAWALAGLVTSVSLYASAQTLTAADFAYHLQRYDVAQQSWLQMNATEQAYFFNRARCECAGDTTSFSGYFRIAIQPGPVTGDKIKALLGQNVGGNGVARLYAGTNVVSCLSPASSVGALSNYCLNLSDPGDASAGIEGASPLRGAIAAIVSTSPHYS
jgi:hypothetical protein